jgi:hypothetical protein
MGQVVKTKAGGYYLRYRNPGSLSADREAEQDVFDYLTAKQKNYLLLQIQGGVRFSRIRLMCSLVGVTGYPVAALIRLHHPRYLSRFSQRRV